MNLVTNLEAQSGIKIARRNTNNMYLIYNEILVVKRNQVESVVVRWMNLEPVIQSEVRKRKTNIVY